MSSPRARIGVASVLLSLLALALACGGRLDDDTPPPPAPVSPTPNPATQRGAPSAGQPRTLGCVASTAVDATMSPVELYPAMAECARADRVEDAVFLFALGGVYGRFDTLRVAVRQGHGAPTILRGQASASVPPPQWTAMTDRVTAVSADPPQLLALCSTIRRTGAPSYHPQYMIAHGSMVLLPTTQDPLVEPFDAAAAWEQALESYLHCPAAAPTAQ